MTNACFRKQWSLQPSQYLLYNNSKHIEYTKTKTNTVKSLNVDDVYYVCKKIPRSVKNTFTCKYKFLDKEQEGSETGAIEDKSKNEDNGTEKDKKEENIEAISIKGQTQTEKDIKASLC